MVFLRRSKEGAPQAHAFDHYPVESWLKVFQELPQREIHLKITGGEPFLDRGNILGFLNSLTQDERFHIRIDTNGTWDPQFFQSVRKDRISLNVSYHPGEESSIESYLQRIGRIRDAGFHVSKINYVLAPENLAEGERSIALFERNGFFVNVGAMISLGAYGSRETREPEEVRILRRYNTPVDLKYRLSNPVTKGRQCFHPALSYYVLYDGSIEVYCFSETRRNWFVDGVPELPRTSVTCPAEHCQGCLEMYRALPDEPLTTEPLGMCDLDDYVREVKAYRRQYRTRSLLRSLPVVRRFVDKEEPIELPSSDRPAHVDVPLAALGQSSPQVVGQIENCYGPENRAALRTRDRLALTGYAYSTRAQNPIREIEVFLDANRLGSIEHFHIRQDCAQNAGYQEAARCGWKTMVYIPSVGNGAYELRLVARTESGETSCFATRKIEVVN